MSARPLRFIKKAQLQPIPADPRIFIPVKAQDLFPEVYGIITEAQDEEEEGFDIELPGMPTGLAPLEEAPFEIEVPEVAPPEITAPETPFEVELPEAAPEAFEVPREVPEEEAFEVELPGAAPEVPRVEAPPIEYFPEEIPTFYPEGTVPGVLAAAARDLRMVRIVYTRLDGATYDYELEPYSYRVKVPQRVGYPEVYLFAYHPEDATIKSFLVDRIAMAEPLDYTFEPRWLVEL